MIGSAVRGVLVKFFIDGSVASGGAVGSVGYALVLGKEMVEVKFLFLHSL